MNELKETFEKIQSQFDELKANHGLEVAELKGTIQFLHTLYAKSIHNYKSKLGGYGKANENYRRQIESLSAELLQTKEELKKALELPNDLDEKMHNEINGMHQTNAMLNTQLKALKDANLKLMEERDAAEINLKHYKSLPWYKRIFAK